LIFIKTYIFEIMTNLNNIEKRRIFLKCFRKKMKHFQTGRFNAL